MGDFSFLSFSKNIGTSAILQTSLLDYTIPLRTGHGDTEHEASSSEKSYHTMPLAFFAGVQTRDQR